MTRWASSVATTEGVLTNSNSGVREVLDEMEALEGGTLPRLEPEATGENAGCNRITHQYSR